MPWHSSQGGLNNNQFNSLHFIVSLETSETTTCAAVLCAYYIYIYIYIIYMYISYIYIYIHTHTYTYIYIYMQ